MVSAWAGFNPAEASRCFPASDWIDANLNSAFLSRRIRNCTHPQHKLQIPSKRITGSLSMVVALLYLNERFVRIVVQV
jgi:hypothetical protein